jgi:hypothetical protein
LLLFSTAGRVVGQGCAPIDAASVKPVVATFESAYYLGGPDSARSNVAVASPYWSGGAPPAVVRTPATAFRPLIPNYSMPPVLYVGQGILGQPKVYVPGQPIRNALRYLSP